MANQIHNKKRDSARWFIKQYGDADLKEDYKADQDGPNKRTRKQKIINGKDIEDSRDYPQYDGDLAWYED